MEELIDDLSQAFDDLSIVTEDNLTYYQLEGKENQEDSLFPRLEIEVVGFDNDEYISQCSIQPICFFGLGYYERWNDLVDSREKSYDRMMSLLEIYYKIRGAIFGLNTKKKLGTLTCTGFVRVNPKYSSNIMHEFIPNHSTIVMAFGIELTEKW